MFAFNSRAVKNNSGLTDTRNDIASVLSVFNSQEKLNMSVVKKGVLLPDEDNWLKLIFIPLRQTPDLILFKRVSVSVIG